LTIALNMANSPDASTAYLSEISLGKRRFRGVRMVYINSPQRRALSSLESAFQLLSPLLHELTVSGHALEVEKVLTVSSGA
jgi:hypothetical protein